MRITTNPVLLGVPVLMVGAMVAVLALWATGTIGGSGIGGNNSSAGIFWNVEYWHKNAAGEVLQHKQARNAIQASGREHAMERLIAAQSTDIALPFATVNAAEIGEANAFDQILLMNADDNLTNGGAGGVGCSDGIDSTQILLLVDGGAGVDNDGAAPSAGSVHTNPADGSYTNVNTTSDGDGKVQVVFLANGDPGVATQMHLVKAIPDDTASGGAADIVANDCLATIEITVDLDNTDTLTITWTLDIS